LAVETYIDRDPAYRAWLAQHPEGWVANTYRSLSPGYLKIHRTACSKAADETHAVVAQPLTGGPYAKTTADTLEELWEWANRQAFRALPDKVLCQLCCKGVVVSASKQRA
jgi:hypothetical protein